MLLTTYFGSSCMKRARLNMLLAIAVVGAGVLLPRMAQGHCDSMDGPVIRAARIALDQQKVAPVLKWVKPEGEAEIKAAFARALAVRKQSPEARELADRFFFETLVRVHRAGEGAPFTGLKPSGTAPEPAIEQADKAVESGSVENVLKSVAENVAAGIRKRFALVRQKQQHAEDSTEAGREYVAAYVDYIHYVEGLQQAAQRAGGSPAETHQAASGEGSAPALLHHHTATE